MDELMVVTNPESEDDAASLDELIFVDNDPDEDTVKQVLDLYYKSMSSSQSVPIFSSLTSDVSDTNESIFYELAVDEFIREYDQTEYATEEMKGEVIDEIVIEYEELYSDSTYHNPANIAALLQRYRCSYIFENNDEYYSELDLGFLNYINNGHGVKFVANDCQNLLFPILTFRGCAGYGEYVNYYDMIANPETPLLGG